MCALTYAVQDSCNGSSREFLITSCGEETPDVGPDLVLPVGQLHKDTKTRRRKGNRLTARVKIHYTPSYLVLGKLLHFLRSNSVASVSALVEVLGEEALQLQAATFIQIVHAGQNAAKSNTATSSNQSEVNCFCIALNKKKQDENKNKSFCVNCSHLLKALKQAVSW